MSDIDQQPPGVDDSNAHAEDEGDGGDKSGDERNRTIEFSSEEDLIPALPPKLDQGLLELVNVEQSNQEAITVPICSPAQHAEDVGVNRSSMQVVDFSSQKDHAVGTIVPINTSSPAQEDTLEGDCSALTIIDHFLLPTPSNFINLHNKDTHIFTVGTHQIVLQKDTESDSYHAKQVEEGTSGLFLVRSIYTTIAALMTGFLFVFCVQLFLFLFLGLLMDSGLTDNRNEAKGASFFGGLLALPLFLNGLANTMTLALAFTVDCFRGQIFFKTITNSDNVEVEWVTFFVFMGMPLFSMCVSLFAKSSYWWEITLLTVFSCVFFYYLVFAAMSILFEVRGCLDLDPDHFDWEKLKKVLLMKQKQRLSGYRKAEYIINSTNDGLPQVATYRDLLDELPQHPKCYFGPWARITKLLSHCSLYEKLPKEHQARQWTLDEVLENNPFVTNHSWSLEKIFCRNTKARYVAIVEGKSKVTDGQVVSSIVFLFLVATFAIVTMLAFLVWMDLGVEFYMVGLVLFISLLWSRFVKAIRTCRNHRTRSNVDNVIEVERENESEAEFTVLDSYLWTKPSEKLCWFELGFEFVFLFLIPLVTLLSTGNAPIGIVFAIVASVCGIRNHVNAASCLIEYGPLSRQTIRGIPHERDWRQKHRLARIVKEVSTGGKSRFWTGIFVFFILIFFMLFVFVLVEGTTDSGSAAKFQAALDFTYEGKQNIQYASCKEQGVQSPSGKNTSLVDFAFLSDLAYESNSTTFKNSLETWFNGTTFKDHEEDIIAFKKHRGSNSANSLVYKFIGFPENDVGVVTIRGSALALDFLIDAQLWSAAILIGWVRSLLPLGTWISPLLKYLVKVASIVESKNLHNVAYYIETSEFLRNITAVRRYSRVVVTGHCKLKSEREKFIQG